MRQSARISDMLEFVMFLINLKSKRVSLYKNWNPEKSDHMKEKKKQSWTIALLLGLGWVVIFSCSEQDCERVCQLER